MEKYKFIVKLGQIKDLITKGQDEKAIELAETVDFKKVKNIEDLGSIAALFLRNGMLLKARECYLELHDRVANRNTVMQLINLALRLKRPSEAEKYLKEYLKIDRNDFYGLIFRYNIDKLEGKPVQDLIPTLEKLKKKEYIEAWAFELAKLYHKAGEVEKCISECDDLIVFFGEGEYVEKAKALKNHYEKEGGREAREKEKAEQEARERAKKEELAEENARAVEEAFAEHDRVDPDVTEFTSDANEEADERGEVEAGIGEAEAEEIEAADAGVTEEDGEIREIVTAAAEEEEDGENKIAEKEEEIREDVTVAADTAVEEAAEADKAEPVEKNEAEESRPEKQLDKDDLLLMQLLREEGIEQPGEIIEEDMLLEDEVISVDAEKKPETEEDTEQPAEAVCEGEEEPEAESGSDAEYEPAQSVDEMPEEEPQEKIVNYSFSEEGLAPVPKGSRLAAFLAGEGCTLPDRFGYMAYINDIRVQIIKAMEIILNPQVMNAGIAVTGNDRSDMINIIKGISKIESASGLIADASCASAPAAKINRMDLPSKVGKLIGRRLVIEEAGALEASSVDSIIKISEKYGRRLGLILTDTRSSLTSLLRDCRDLNSVLPVRIHVPVIDEEDVIGMVRFTIMKAGYCVTESVDRLIVSRIKGITHDRNGKYAAAGRFVKAVIDNADKRITDDYLEATADGRRAVTANMITEEDVRVIP